MSLNQMSIARCFQRLIQDIQPSEPELMVARLRLSAVRRRLAETFNLRRPLLSGSFARGTFIRGGSDVDLFAVISKKDFSRAGELFKSGTVLANVRYDLLQRCRATEVTTDVNAALLPFAKACRFDYERDTSAAWEQWSIVFRGGFPKAR
jgi:predicted nucleotidyltransferase